MSYNELMIQILQKVPDLNSQVVVANFNDGDCLPVEWLCTDPKEMNGHISDLPEQPFLVVGVDRSVLA